jgi:hypothetical protein
MDGNGGLPFPMQLNFIFRPVFLQLAIIFKLSSSVHLSLLIKYLIQIRNCLNSVYNFHNPLTYQYNSLDLHQKADM